MVSWAVFLGCTAWDSCMYHHLSNQHPSDRHRCCLWSVLTPNNIGHMLLSVLLQALVRTFMLQSVWHGQLQNWTRDIVLIWIPGVHEHTSFLHHLPVPQTTIVDCLSLQTSNKWGKFYFYHSLENYSTSCVTSWDTRRIWLLRSIFCVEISLVRFRSLSGIFLILCITTGNSFAYNTHCPPGFPGQSL